jgi:hypothetical protein
MAHLKRPRYVLFYLLEQEVGGKQHKARHQSHPLHVWLHDLSRANAEKALAARIAPIEALPSYVECIAPC